MTATSPDCFTEHGRLPSVHAFVAGTHKGKLFTRADLDDMVRNFERFSVGKKPLLHVPLVIGHGEEQDLLAKDDLPAAGWGARLYRHRDDLYVDFSDVPSRIAKLIKTRRYRTVSVEIYDHPPPGIPGTGKMLRRVALLGGDIPAVKGLGEIEVPDDFAEEDRNFRTAMISTRVTDCRSHPTQSGCYTVFSEVKTMDRDGMISALTEKGFDAATITPEIPDAFLVEVLRCMEAAMEEIEVEKNNEDKKDDEKEKTDRELLRNEPEKDGQMEKYSEQAVRRIVEKAVADALKTNVKDDFDALNRFREETHAAEKKRTIDAFLESRLKEGKILPAEIDGGLRDRLCRADARAVVRKFKESGKELALTELDLQMREIDARPARKFGERFQQPVEDAKTGEDAEVSKLEEHFEVFSEAFAKTHMTKEKLVAGFKSERKRNPKLTADEFLNR